jgi:hypothetical protein
VIDPLAILNSGFFLPFTSYPPSKLLIWRTKMLWEAPKTALALCPKWLPSKNLVNQTIFTFRD